MPEPALERRAPDSGVRPARRDRAASPWRFYAVAITSVLAVTAAAWAALVLFELADIRAALQRSAAQAADAPVTAEEPLPVLREADIALARARAQFATGHVLGALELLDTIRPLDPAQAEADRLRAEIQRALGVTVQPSPSNRTAPGVRPGRCHEVPEVLVHRFRGGGSLPELRLRVRARDVASRGTRHADALRRR